MEDGSQELEINAGKSWETSNTSELRFRRDKAKRKSLRKDILSAIEPVQEKEAKVVNVKGEVAVVTKSRAIPILVPPQFDSGAVVRMVMSVLEKQGIEAKRVREIAARKQARVALEALRRENERRLRKRRRDEEILLLM